MHVGNGPGIFIMDDQTASGGRERQIRSRDLFVAESGDRLQEGTLAHPGRTADTNADVVAVEPVKQIAVIRYLLHDIGMEQPDVIDQGFQRRSLFSGGPAFFGKIIDILFQTPPEIQPVLDLPDPFLALGALVWMYWGPALVGLYLESLK